MSIVAKRSPISATAEFLSYLLTERGRDIHCHRFCWLVDNRFRAFAILRLQVFILAYLRNQRFPSCGEGVKRKPVEDRQRRGVFKTCLQFAGDGVAGAGQL